VLQVPNATVNHFETVGGGTGTEIVPLDESDSQPAQRGFTGGGGPCGSATYDEEVVFGSRQLCKISMHRFFFRCWQRRPSHLARRVPAFIGEKSPAALFSGTAASLTAAKSTVFAACRDAWLRPDGRNPRRF
jgi:hypothetical protein